MRRGSLRAYSRSCTEAKPPERGINVPLSSVLLVARVSKRKEKKKGGGEGQSNVSLFSPIKTASLRLTRQGLYTKSCTSPGHRHPSAPPNFARWQGHGHPQPSSCPAPRRLPPRPGAGSLPPGCTWLRWSPGEGKRPPPGCERPPALSCPVLPCPAPPTPAPAPAAAEHPRLLRTGRGGAAGSSRAGEGMEKGKKKKKK